MKAHQKSGDVRGYQKISVGQWQSAEHDQKPRLNFLRGNRGPLSNAQDFFITQQLKTLKIPQFLVVLPNYVANHALFWPNFMSRIMLSW